MDIEGALAVARLIAELGAVDGRKRLQKLVHLLGAANHTEFKHRFILHYYGPFSRQLAAQLDFLGAAGLVEEESPADETATFRYRVAGEDAVERVKDMRCGAEEPPRWAGLAQALNCQNTDFLEAVSTLVYLHSHRATGDDLDSKFEQAKPQLTGLLSAARTFARKESLID